MLFPLSLKCVPVLVTLTQTWLFCSSYAEENVDHLAYNYNCLIFTHVLVLFTSAYWNFFKGREQRNFVAMYQRPSLSIALIRQLGIYLEVSEDKKDAKMTCKMVHFLPTILGAHFPCRHPVYI